MRTMTPLARKAKSERILRKERIPINEQLPCIESDRATKVRSSREVAARMICLYCVTGTAFDRRDRKDEQGYGAFLKKHKLWAQLTPQELAFMKSKRPSQEAVTQFTWRSESLYLLLWAS